MAGNEQKSRNADLITANEIRTPLAQALFGEQIKTHILKIKHVRNNAENEPRWQARGTVISGQMTGPRQAREKASQSIVSENTSQDQSLGDGAFHMHACQS